MIESASLGIQLSLTQILVVIVALFVGGIVKGATGAGAPIIAVPVMAAFIDVNFAIIAMLMPNLWTNIWQFARFRGDRPERAFLWPYVAGGAVGIVLGTLLLAAISARALSIGMAVSVLAYLAFKLARPTWQLSWPTALRLAVPAGLVGGILQGATGVSAPATLSFLHAMKLPRKAFVATVALLFLVFTIVHLASLGIAGLLLPAALALGFIGLVPMMLGMRIGTILLDRLSPGGFERLLQALLFIIAAKILWQQVFQ